MTERKTKLLACLLVAVAATVAYLPVFNNSFAWDDEYLVLKNPAISDVSNIPGFFADSWAGGVDYDLGKAQNRPYFRPMALTSMTLDWAIAGPNPVVFHTTNLLIHILAACCLFLWLLKVFETAIDDPRRFSRPLLAALGGALVWAVHPVSTEAVCLVSYRTSLISGMTIFASLLLLTPAADKTDRPAGIRPPAIVAAVLLYIVGLLSKETTLVMPGLLFVMDIAARRFKPKRILAVYMPLAIVAVVWLGVRSQFTGEGVYTYFAGLTTGQSVLMFGRIFYLYIRLAFVPWPLCPFYDWGIIGVPRSILEPDIAAGFLLAAGILAAGVITAKKRPLFASGLWFFLMALLPVSHIIPFFDAAGDRFMYVPLAGVILAISGFIVEAPPSPRWKRPGAALYLVILVSLMSLTFARSAQWKDSETMLKVTVRDFPTSISAHLGLGRLLLEKQRPEQAAAALKQVRDLAPNLAVGHALLAVAQARMGDIHEARLTLRMSPMPSSSDEISAVQIARGELLKAGETDLARRLGLLGP